MPLNKANKLIDALNRIDLKSPKAYEIVVDTLKYYDNLITLFAVDMVPNENVFYVRARIYENLSDYYRTIHDHSYNIYPEYIKIGRANKPHQQIFYAGRSRITSLAEVNIIENKMEEEIVSYAVSRWQLKKYIKLAAIFNVSNIEQIDAWELQGFLEYVKNTISDHPDKTIIKVYKFISGLFAERVAKGEEYKYVLTSAFANILYEKFPEIGGIMYQSVKDPRSYNLALKKEYIDNGYFLPDTFVKNEYQRYNIIELDETKRELSSKYDIGLDLVEWDNEPEDISIPGRIQ